MRRVPSADCVEQGGREERAERAECNSPLAIRADDGECHEWTDGRPGVPPNLEQRLGEPVPAAGREPRDPGRFQVEHRRTAIEQRGCEICAGECSVLKWNGAICYVAEFVRIPGLGLIPGLVRLLTPTDLAVEVTPIPTCPFCGAAVETWFGESP